MTDSESHRRPSAMCGWCGRQTTAVAGVCADCVGIDLAVKRGPVSDHYALGDGTWRMVRGVLRWFAAPSSLPPSQTFDVCGTDSGYYRHRNRGEERCRPCKDAHAAAERDRLTREVAS